MSFALCSLVSCRLEVEFLSCPLEASLLTFRAENFIFLHLCTLDEVHTDFTGLVSASLD